LDTGFQEYYASLDDDELLHIAGDRKHLREEAVLALDSEMSLRGLTRQQVLRKRKEEIRRDIEDLRPRQPKGFISKYLDAKIKKHLVAQINLRAYFLGLIGLVLLMFFIHRVPDEWSDPSFVVYMLVLIACLAVQPWIRRTLSFWLSLAISCVTQFVIGHWLRVYHPAFFFLSLFAGYALCGAAFVLLQKLKPEADGSSEKL
jgi:hypothetical protein